MTEFNKFLNLSTILLCIHNSIEFPKLSPMIIAVWHGETKPLVNEYIMRLVTELKDILSTGVFINSKHIIVKLGAVICDTPARSLMKGIHVFFKFIHIQFYYTMVKICR